MRFMPYYEGWYQRHMKHNSYHNHDQWNLPNFNTINKEMFNFYNHFNTHPKRCPKKKCHYIVYLQYSIFEAISKWLNLKSQNIAHGHHPSLYSSFTSIWIFEHNNEKKKQTNKVKHKKHTIQTTTEIPHRLFIRIPVHSFCIYGIRCSLQ